MKRKTEDCDCSKLSYNNMKVIDLDNVCVAIFQKTHRNSPIHASGTSPFLLKLIVTPFQTRIDKSSGHF